MKPLTSIAIIPARMNSTRLPNKPMKSILGMPMIGHVYHRAKLIESCEEVCVATCDQVIFDYIKNLGGLAVMTSNLHERATDRTAEALQKLKETHNKEFDLVAMIQGDEPMFNPHEVNLGVLELSKDPQSNIVNLMNKIESNEDFLDSNNVKVVVDKNNKALYFSREAVPSGWKDNNKNHLYLQTGLIIFKVSYLNTYLNLDPTPLEEIESCDMLRVLEHGQEVKMFLVPTRSIGVDVESDLQTVESILKNDPIVEGYIE
jgi:3-deoxy-manno-octulosonate cytidylyltransferase (CMP-KDO synthetase)